MARSLSWRQYSALRFRAIAVGLLAVACWLPARGAPETKPAEAIDFDKARVLIDRTKRGEKLSPDEQAYLDRAKIEYQKLHGANAPAGRPAGAPPARPSIGLTPLPELTGDVKYKGFEGGLYGGGKNEPPAAHAKLASTAAAEIRPLDAAGKPDANGRIVLLSIGMSNTTMEFSRFKQLADEDKARSPLVTIVDAAQGGRAADDWTDAKMPTWEEAGRRLAAAKVSPSQVQVVWIKQARKGPSALGEFPQHAKSLQADLENILRAAKTRYPNVKLAFLSSRIYAGNASSNLNPEPYAYESAFSVQWTIAKQAAGDADLNCDPAKGAIKAPVALWGPYLWADGTKGRKSDALVWTPDDFGPDGTHPGNSGRQKVAELLLAFFKTDERCKTWFVH